MGLKAPTNRYFFKASTQSSAAGRVAYPDVMVLYYGPRCAHRARLGFFVFGGKDG